MNSVKELIREKMRIQDVIGSYVTLVPAGQNYKACCPFHIEKTPSFQINTERQMYYCFGCKKGGDVFSFVQEVERVDFREALKILAEKSGVDIKESAELVKEMQTKKNLIKIHEYATRFYQLCLSQNQPAMQYLVSRAVTPVTIKEWRIGYAPNDFQALTRVLTQKGFTEFDLIQSGLVGKGNNGLYDRFRGRVMFPITDNQGVIVGFSGRILPEIYQANPNTGKYINSPETAIYHKSSILFGFSFAKREIGIKKTKVIVEGQFDTILLHQFGNRETIALSGTAATDYHMEQIARFAQKIIIATDGDNAGIASAHKIAMLGYRFGIDVSLIVLPEGTDPADLVSQNKDRWQEIIQSEKDYITFHGEITKKLSLRERIISVENNLFPLLGEIQNHVQQDAKLQVIARQLEVSLESIRSEFQKFLKKKESSSQFNSVQDIQLVHKESRSSFDIQLEELSLILYLFPVETKSWFKKNEDARIMVQKITRQFSEQDRAEVGIRYDSLDETTWNIRLDTLWLRIRQLSIDMKIGEIRNKIHSLQDEQVAQELQRELLSLQKEKENLVRSLAE